MACIEKRQTKQGVKYRVRITLKNHPRISETFPTRREATRWAQSTEAAIRERRYQPESEADRNTVGDLIDRYIEVKVAKLARAEESTRILEWWCNELGEDTRLSKVTPAVIAEARDRLARGKGRSGKKLSSGSVLRYLTIISGAFTAAAREWFLIEDNPCRRVVRPAPPRGRVRFLDKDERERLLAACKDSQEERLYPLVMMALCTGARRGELLNLRWKDVDLDRGVAILQHTKNGDRRALAITGPAEQVLRDWYRQRRLDSDLIFPSMRGTASFPQKQWTNVMDAADIEDFRFHDIRHTFASYLAMSGATLAELAEAMGHKTLAMVKRYAHMTQGHTASVVARMTEKFIAA